MTEPSASLHETSLFSAAAMKGRILIQPYCRAGGACCGSQWHFMDDWYAAVYALPTVNSPPGPDDLLYSA